MDTTNMSLKIGPTGKTTIFGGVALHQHIYVYQIKVELDFHTAEIRREADGTLVDVIIDHHEDGCEDADGTTIKCLGFLNKAGVLPELGGYKEE